MAMEKRMNEWSGLRRPTLNECVLIQEHKNGQNCPETLKLLHSIFFKNQNGAPNQDDDPSTRPT